MVSAGSDTEKRCSGCTWGWVHVHPGSIPTVAPCAAHRPILHARWLAGALTPDIPDYWQAVA